MRAPTTSALPLAIAMLCAFGCMHTRYSAVVSVEGGGAVLGHHLKALELSLVAAREHGRLAPGFQ